MEGRGIPCSWVRVRVRVRGRIRVTKLVYQVGFTTPFQVSRARKYFSSKQQQAAASSSKQASSSSKQAATELISAYPHISINIDGTSPKLAWYIVLMMPYDYTKLQVKTHQGAGSVGKKV